MSQTGEARSAIALLRAHGLAAKKRLGQNFLLDAAICARIADAAVGPSPAPRGTVLEIGAGLGALTRPLLSRAAKVVAIERDRDLFPILQGEFAEQVEAANLDLVLGDAIAMDWLDLLKRGPAPHRVVGNLPYLVTGRILERIVELAPSVDRASFMVQLEVAERLLASPGTKEYGALTVFVRAAYEVEKVMTVRAGAFHPRPEVDSAVVVFSPAKARTPETPTFRELVRSAFALRRKTLRNAWRQTSFDDETIARSAAAVAIELDRRGETLSVQEFANMAQRVDAERS